MQLPIGPCPSPPHTPPACTPRTLTLGETCRRRFIPEEDVLSESLQKASARAQVPRPPLWPVKHFFLSFVLTLPPSTFKYISDTMGFNGYIHVDETWIMPFLHLSWLKSHDLSSTLCTEVDPMPSDILVTFLQTSPKVQTWFSKGALMPWEQRQVQPKWGH